MNTIELTPQETEFFKAYIEALYFTECGPDGEHDVDSTLDQDFERESLIDCLAFYSRIQVYLGSDNIARAGHDFWLTRNGHGTGFWDRPEVYGETYSEMFTKHAKSFSECIPIFE